jgi:hypothetical protein
LTLLLAVVVRLIINSFALRSRGSLRALIHVNYSKSVQQLHPASLPHCSFRETQRLSPFL